jgi:molybdopterin-guanine dinucleotide biosynthesis protein B
VEIETEREGPEVIAVTGFKDSGKTTAVEMLGRELVRRGYRVATVKHCHHGFDLDRPGKDSWAGRR